MYSPQIMRRIHGFAGYTKQLPPLIEAAEVG